MTSQKITILLLLIVLPCLESCAPQISFDEKILKERVLAYYALEAKEEWRLAYDFRTPGFRKVVPLESYLKSMETDNHGWKLISYTILDVAKKDEDVNFRIQFIEKGPLSALPKDVRESISLTNKATSVTVKTEGISAWRYIDGKWYCVNAVSRDRLTQNEAIVP